MSTESARDEIAALEQQLAAEKGSIEMFKSPLWGLLEETASKMRDKVAAGLLSDVDISERKLGFAQGKVAALEWLLSRRSGVADRIEKCQKRLGLLREQERARQNRLESRVGADPEIQSIKRQI